MPHQRKRVHTLATVRNLGCGYKLPQLVQRQSTVSDHRFREYGQLSDIQWARHQRPCRRGCQHSHPVNHQHMFAVQPFPHMHANMLTRSAIVAIVQHNMYQRIIRHGVGRIIPFFGGCIIFCIAIIRRRRFRVSVGRPSCDLGMISPRGS